MNTEAAKRAHKRMTEEANRLQAKAKGMETPNRWDYIWEEFGVRKAAGILKAEMEVEEKNKGDQT